MNARSRSSRLVLWGLGGFMAGLMAAEPPTPPRVPWNDIEAWAMSGPAQPAGADSAEKPPVKTASAPVVPDAPPPTTPPTETGTGRPVDRKRTPPAWTERHNQISIVMASRLKATTTSQHNQLYEIHYLMEQYEKALTYLVAMLKEPRKWTREDASGWLAGRVWETGLLKGGTLNADAVKKYYDEWVVKERSRLVQQAEVLRPASLKWQEQFFEAHQTYFKTTQNIADLIRKKEQEGESNPAALWEMCDRFHNQHPDAPVVYLRFLYKLREWYPEFDAVKKGTVQQHIAHALAGNRLRLYKEAAEEMEMLLEKWPQADSSINGYGNYFAGRFWQYHGDAVKAAQERNALRDAHDAWQKALTHAQKVQKDFPKCPLNEPNDGAPSTIQAMIRYLNRRDHLGSKIGR